MADITYDIDKIIKARDAIANLKDDLNECDTNLNTSLVDLKSAWVTPAGKKFFNEHKNNWSTYVKKYTKKLSGIEHMLDTVISEYQKINDDVRNVKM